MEIITSFVGYLLVIIYDSLVSLILVSLIFLIFRIKDSNIKILFLFLPLVKPFIIILEDFNLNSDFFENRQGTLGFRFPSPNTILSRIDKLENSPFHATNINLTIILSVVLLFVVILVIRWINLYLFSKKLAYEEKIKPEDIPNIYKIMAKFSKKIDIETPSISLTQNNNFQPFVIGIKRHLFVVSPKLLDDLIFEEKEILIKHELSHIKRRDNLIGWSALILRDLLIFNPFAHIAYSLIRLEQEVGTDKIVVEFSNYSKKEVAKHIISLILKIKRGNCKNNNLDLPYNNSLYRPLKKLNFLILNYRIKSILRIDRSKIKANKISHSFFYLLFLLLLLIQIVLIIKLDNIFLLLR